MCRAGLYDPLEVRSFSYWQATYPYIHGNDFPENKQNEPQIFRSITEFLSQNRATQFDQGLRDDYLLSKFYLVRCYICGVYNQFYSQSQVSRNRKCWKCEQFNDFKKKTTRDLSGKYAIITGGRIKLGFATALRLLRNNCFVIVTTRFCKNAMQRYQDCPDYLKWKDNLRIYPLDLRYASSIIGFIQFIQTNFNRIDILINNAAQTIHRPKKYYSKLLTQERNTQVKPDSLLLLSEQECWEVANNTAQDNSMQNQSGPNSNPFPALSESSEFQATSTHDNNYESFQVDKYGEPIDDRKDTTWTQPLNKTPPVELFETQCINTIAPSMLVSQLFESMKVQKARYFAEPSQHHSDAAYIINVTSDEGHFSDQSQKTDYHVHNNLSKAALNMLTRSAASYYARHGIIMNSVDTGWVSSVTHTYIDPPLSVEDGAARILDPILSCYETHGKLWKNFNIVEW